jgi:hypothetical protein
MSGSRVELPFREILLLAGIRSGGLVNLETDRASFSLQLRRYFTATIRPILVPAVGTNHLSYSRLRLKTVPGRGIIPKGAKFYSFWVGFLAVRGSAAKIRTSALDPTNSRMNAH